MSETEELFKALAAARAEGYQLGMKDRYTILCSHLCLRCESGHVAKPSGIGPGRWWHESPRELCKASALHEYVSWEKSGP